MCVLLFLSVDFFNYVLLSLPYKGNIMLDPGEPTGLTQPLICLFACLYFKTYFYFFILLFLAEVSC